MHNIFTTMSLEVLELSDSWGSYQRDGGTALITVLLSRKRECFLDVNKEQFSRHIVHETIKWTIKVDNLRYVVLTCEGGESVTLSVVAHTRHLIPTPRLRDQSKSTMNGGLA